MSSQPARFQCHFCSRNYTRAFNLRNHENTHTGERPFLCSVCGQSFTRSHDRKTHEKLHTGEMEWSCGGPLRNGGVWGCSRRFARKSNLMRHFRSRIGRECIAPLSTEETPSSSTAPDIPITQSGQQERRLVHLPWPSPKRMKAQISSAKSPGFSDFSDRSSAQSDIDRTLGHLKISCRSVRTNLTILRTYLSDPQPSIVACCQGANRSARLRPRKFDELGEETGTRQRDTLE